MSRRHWALVVVLVLFNYIVFASLIAVVVDGRRVAPAEPTPIPLPTFTAMPSPTAIVLLPTATPVPTATPIPLVVETPTAESQAPAQTPTPAFTGPYTQVDVTLNVRSGPGTEYDKVGSIPPGAAVEIAGRNADSSWWQIRYASAPGGLGWVSSDYGTAYRIEEIPLVEAPAPPQPTVAPAPTSAASAEATPVPQPEQPQYQFSPSPWYGGEPNAAIGRFYGHLNDAASGVMVNGYSIRATCGDFAVLSFPSGPSPVAPDWEAGWYDIVIPNPVTCNWTLQVVEYQCGGSGFNAQCTQFRPLSEAVAVSTNVETGETIIVADWTKNW